MKRKVYLSFLGLGSYNEEAGRYFYQETVYELNGKTSEQTPFVQVAELALLDGRLFDRVFIATTQKSYDAHFESLKKTMTRQGIIPDALILDENFSPEGQWKWFETLLSVIEPGDRLTVDLTHGYRAVPIIFSAAVNFLQKARDIKLEAVYYGAFDANRKLAPIVDMKEFYLINEWADSVSRLVEDADVRKLSETAGKTSEFQIGELNDPEVSRVFMALTDAIRNVEVNHVGEKTKAALELINAKSQNASLTGKMLLDMVTDKFTHLATQGPVTRQYDLDYFRVQIEIIRLLMEHRLFMQAYTVMREFIPSLAMIYYEKRGITNKKRKKIREFKSEVFLQMVLRPEGEWNFGDGNRKIASQDLYPFFKKLLDAGIVDIAQGFLKKLVAYRNGFDHAWTSVSGAKNDIQEQAESILKELEIIYTKVIKIMGKE